MHLTPRFLLQHASAFVFCLVVAAASGGCSRGVRFTIEKARVSPLGTITFAYRESTTGACKITEPGGESCSEGGFGDGGSGSSTMDTDDPSSVRFFVREGESFFLAPGTRKRSSHTPTVPAAPAGRPSGRKISLPTGFG